MPKSNKYIIANKENVQIELSAAPTRKESLKLIGCETAEEWNSLKKIGFQVVKL